MADVTNAIVNAIFQNSVDAVLDANATAAVEIAAGFWSRAFSTADVEPNNGLPQPFMPAHVMGAIGRDLVTKGESVWYLEIHNGAPVMVPVTWFSVEGSYARNSWVYRLQASSPTTALLDKTVRQEGVVHVRYSFKADAPWRGVSPLAWATDTARALGQAERRLMEESGTPTGYVMPTPHTPVDPSANPDLFDPLAMLKAEIRTLAGKILVVETMQTGWGDGRAAAPQTEWQPRRIGADPPMGLMALRDQVQTAILSACGIPPSLSSAQPGASQSNREAWRQFLHGTIQPVAQLVQEELRAKLNAPRLR